MEEKFYPKEERLYYLAFSNTPKIGSKTFKNLVKHFGSAKKAWRGSLEGFKAAGYTENLYFLFTEFRKKFNIQDYLKKLKFAKVEFISQIDKDYPKRLFEIDSPPIVLYSKGSTVHLNAKKTIGIVGTRKMTSYGKEVTEKLAGELSNFGFTIISGMALGVDATAHKSTLENGGATIAVLGNGVDLPFPRENENLYNEIIDKRSLIISEYPLGMQPTIGSFPARNRIVAGLSDAILVTEAGADSGSLITANEAIKQGKLAFAVPGSITSSQSKGTSHLIRNGGKLISDVKDILDEFGVKNNIKSREADFSGLSKQEIKIVEMLMDEDLDVDTISKKTKMKTQELMVILSSLEMRGVVKNVGGGVFSIDL